MDFQNLKIKNIELAIKFQTDIKSWTVKNCAHHVLGIALSGREFHDLGYQSFLLDENCIFFLNQRDDYKVYAQEMGSCYVVHFTTYEPIETDSFAIKISNTVHVIQMFSKLAAQKSFSGAKEHQAVSDFYRICALFEEIRMRSYSPKDLRMLKAREYMDLHFGEPDCLEKTYDGCDLSRRRFDELFKSSFSVTPHAYVMALRIEYAKNLLPIQNISIREAAELCGFGDVYYFSKVFKKETGMTPGSFRKKFCAVSVSSKNENVPKIF